MKTEMKLKEFVSALIQQRLTETERISKSPDELAYFIDGEMNDMLRMLGSHIQVDVYAININREIKAVQWVFNSIEEVAQV